MLLYTSPAAGIKAGTQHTSETMEVLREKPGELRQQHVSRAVYAASTGKRKPTVRKTMEPGRWMRMGVALQRMH